MCIYVYVYAHLYTPTHKNRTFFKSMFNVKPITTGSPFLEGTFSSSSSSISSLSLSLSCFDAFFGSWAGFFVS